jgi:hypothetical protein
MLAHTTTANFHQIWYEELSKALCNPDNMIQSNHVFQGLMLGINHPFFEATYPHRQHLIQKELWKATQDQRDGTKINHLLAINRKFGFDTETTPYHRTMAKMMHYLSEPITVGTIYSISASTNMPPPHFIIPLILHTAQKRKYYKDDFENSSNHKKSITSNLFLLVKSIPSVFDHNKKGMKRSPDMLVKGMPAKKRTW